MIFDLREICLNNVLVLNVLKGFYSFVYRYVIINRFFVLINLFGFFFLFVFYMWDEFVFFGFLVEFNYKFFKKDKEFMMVLRSQFGEFIYKGIVKEELWREYLESIVFFIDNGVIVFKEEYYKRECDFWLE